MNYKRKNYHRSCTTRVATCYQEDGKPKTRSGLSYTPAQMNEMMQKGIPVTNKNLENKFFDGETNPSWNIDILRQKGVDIADVWEADQAARQKLRDTRKEYIKRQKDNKND